MDGDWGLVTSNTITPPMRSRPRKAKVRSPKVTEVTASGSGPLLSERFRNEAPALWLELKKSAQGIFRSAPAKQVSLARYCSTISPESTPDRRLQTRWPLSGHQTHIPRRTSNDHRPGLQPRRR